MAEELDQQDELVVLAKVASHAGRYEDMKEYMRERVMLGKPLSAEERDLLSEAYKGIVTGLRLAISATSAAVRCSEDSKNSEEVCLAQSYREDLEAELQQVCQEIIGIISGVLMTKVEVGEPSVFYLKLTADYNRYMSESTSGDVQKQAQEAAAVFYEEALAEAEEHLLAFHPVRLGLVLNYSVFQHQVLGDQARAVEIAGAAYRHAVHLLATMPVESQADAETLLGQLKSNLCDWQESADSKE